ncbi:MAG: hypothetical protein DCF25_21825 [Leptolyngbya foveolarum]|uniref:Uncharacterized protein n=1 Tax=Leptolyngbya foveolarum TaxID=47253 RepID=A0A2W4TWP0_9CYAN|nr:MAG: hypothetical protein DCF25_21825 [Leptolyngbya foveolarum]
MPNSARILSVVRELEPQLPALLGEKATEVRNQISPLLDQLVAGQSDGSDLLKVLCAYPKLAEELRQRFDQQQNDDFFDDLASRETIEFSRGYSQPAGTPNSAIAGQRYICPVPDCPEDWFRRGVGQSPPLCEEHGVVMVEDAG